MAETKTARPTRARDLADIRERGGSWQVRVYGGRDPVTGKQLILTGSAPDEKAAIRLRNKLRREVESHKSARTNVSVRHLLTAWLAWDQAVVAVDLGGLAGQDAGRAEDVGVVGSGGDLPRCG